MITLGKIVTEEPCCLSMNTYIKPADSLCLARDEICQYHAHYGSHYMNKRRFRWLISELLDIDTSNIEERQWLSEKTRVFESQFMCTPQCWKCGTTMSHGSWEPCTTPLPVSAYPQLVVFFNEHSPIIYQMWEKFKPKIPPFSTPLQIGECAICAEEYSLESGGALRCGHSFHRECLSIALSYKRSCPLCRKSINEE